MPLLTRNLKLRQLPQLRRLVRMMSSKWISCDEGDRRFRLHHFIPSPREAEDEADAPCVIYVPGFMSHGRGLKVEDYSRPEFNFVFFLLSC